MRDFFFFFKGKMPMKENGKGGWRSLGKQSDSDRGLTSGEEGRQEGRLGRKSLTLPWCSENGSARPMMR